MPSSLGTTSQPAAAPKTAAKADDDDVDLFGSDEEEVSFKLLLWIQNYLDNSGTVDSILDKCVGRGLILIYLYHFPHNLVNGSK